MKTAFITTVTACATIALATVAGSAHADLAAEAAQAHRGELSQINGVPVPVGDHNQYYFGGPRYNVSLNPIGLMVGVYSASASVALTDHVVIRGDGTLYQPTESDDHGFQIGLSAPIYFRRAYQGAFLEPGLMVRSMTDPGESYDGYVEQDVTTTEVGPSVLFGWHWTWDSGLNLAIAAGLGRNIGADEKVGEADVFFDGYFRVGYAF